MMEENSGYLVRRIWRKLILPSFCCEIAAFIAANLVAFFLIARYCSASDLVIYSAFLQMFVLYGTVDIFFGDAAGSCFAICKGAGNSLKAQCIFAENLTVFLVVMSSAYLLLCWQMPAVVRFLNLPPDLYPRAITYGRILAVSGIFNGLVCIFQDFLRNDSLPRTAAGIATGSLAALILPTILFIGFFHYGVVAYAVIQLVVSALQILVSLIPFLLKKTTIHLQIKWMTRQIFKDIFAIACGRQIYMVISFLVNVLFMRWLLGSFPPAATTICALLETIVAFLIAFSKPFVLTMQSITGIFRGEKNYNGMSYCFKFVLMHGFFASTTVGIVVFLLAEQIVQWLPVQENFPGEAIFAVHVVGATTPIFFLFQFLIAFYNVSGHNKMISAISILAQGGVYPIVSVIFFFVIKKEECFWYYFFIALSCDVIMAFLVAWCVMKKQHYSNILLLPRPADMFMKYCFLLKNSPQEFADYRKMMMLFLRKHHVCENVLNRAKLLFEELFLFASEHTDKDTGRFFAMSVILCPENQLQITLHFDSNISCLNSALNGITKNLLPEKIPGAILLKKVSDDIYIDRIYGFNYILLTLKEAATSVPEVNSEDLC